MTTTTVAQRANLGNIASPDQDLQIMLRTEVIPAFLMDVGYPSWRTVYLVADLLSGEWKIDVPLNVGRVKTVFGGESFGTELTYIGEEPHKRAAFQTTVPGTPSQFDIQFGIAESVVGGGPGMAVVFNCPSDADVQMKVVYDIGNLFGEDYTSERELNEFIPIQVQPALICGLRRLIYKERYGTGDRRFELEDQEYQRWIARLSEDPRLANRRIVHRMA